MDDEKKGYRGGLYGSPDEADDFTPYVTQPDRQTALDEFRDPLFEEDVNPKSAFAQKLALFSMICGIVSLLMAACGYAAFVTGPIAMIAGIVSRVMLRYEEDPRSRHFATAGIVLGIMGICIGGLLWFMGWTINSGQDAYSNYLRDTESRVTQ